MGKLGKLGFGGDTEVDGCEIRIGRAERKTRIWAGALGTGEQEDLLPLHRPEEIPVA